MGDWVIGNLELGIGNWPYRYSCIRYPYIRYSWFDRVLLVIPSHAPA